MPGKPKLDQAMQGGIEVLSSPPSLGIRAQPNCPPCPQQQGPLLSTSVTPQHPRSSGPGSHKKESKERLGLALRPSFAGGSQTQPISRQHESPLIWTLSKRVGRTRILASSCRNVSASQELSELECQRPGRWFCFPELAPSPPPSRPWTSYWDLTLSSGSLAWP